MYHWMDGTKQPEHDAEMNSIFVSSQLQFLILQNILLKPLETLSD